MPPNLFVRRVVAGTSSIQTRRRAFSLHVRELEDRCVPSTFRWINPAGGNFAAAANWQDQAGNSGVPGAADDALILTTGITVLSVGTNAVRHLTSTAALTITAGTLTVTAATLVGPTVISGGTLVLAGTATASTLTLSSGSLGGAGQWTVNSSMNWSGGEVAVGVHIASTATLDIVNVAPVALDNVTMTNDGTATWSGAGEVDFRHNAAVQNNGLFRDQAAHVAAFSGDLGELAEFHNRGEFVRQSGAGVTDFGVRFDNRGVLRVEVGTLRLNGGHACAFHST